MIIHNRIFLSVFTLLSLSLFTACTDETNHDKAIEHKLIGTWHKEFKQKNRIMRVVTKFTKDHRFATYARVGHSHRKFYAVGHWHVKYGTLVEYTTKSNYVRAKTRTYDKILSIRYKQFAYKTEDGEVFSYYRSR